MGSLKTYGLKGVRLNTGDEETQLLAEARRGEEQALERIFRTHKDRVFSICLRMTGNYYEAEDLLQETFVQAFKNLAGFRGDSSLGTWIYRVTVNVVIDSLRRKHPRFETATEDAALNEIIELPLSERRTDLTLERLRLERAIAVLPPGYRAVLVLHDVEGYSHEEIAQNIGSTTGTCKSQLHKARRKLRELLSRN